MTTPAHAVAYADCEWSAACLTALDEQGDPQWTAWKDNAMQRAREATPKVEPLANWSDLVFARAPRPYRYQRSEEHTSELQSLMRISYAVFCLKKKSEYAVSQPHCITSTQPTTQTDTH